MPQWLRNLDPRVIVFVLFIAFSIGANILKRVQKAKAERELKQRHEQAELERMRTGGVEPMPVSRPRHTPMMEAPAPAPPSVSGPRQATLEEIAEARRRKIEELRRTQQAKAPAPQPAPGGTRVVRLPNGIAIELPEGVAVPAPPLRPKPQKQRALQPVREVSPVQAIDAAYAAPPAPAQAAPARVPAPRPGFGRASGVAAILAAGDRATVRRAIVLSEVLGPPVGARLLG